MEQTKTTENDKKRHNQSALCGIITTDLLDNNLRKRTKIISVTFYKEELC
jgi:hypothetical protein